MPGRDVSRRGNVSLEIMVWMVERHRSLPGGLCGLRVIYAYKPSDMVWAHSLLALLLGSRIHPRDDADKKCHTCAFFWLRIPASLGDHDCAKSSSPTAPLLGEKA